MRKLAFLSMLGLIAAGAPVSAAVITGVTATASSTANGFDRGAAHAVDGSGYSAATGFVSTTPDGTMWLSNGNGALGGTADPTPSIVFDLGAIYNVANARVWNYNEPGNTTGGIKTGTVLYSTTGTTYTTLAALSLAQAPGSSTVDFSQVVSLGVSARFIEFSNLVNQVNDSFVGLSEVVFSSVNSDVPPSVPEPASLLVLTAGLLGLGAARARARR